jgi:preprotein translocase subunit YajC
MQAEHLLAFANGSAPSALMQFVPIILIFAIFYFLLLAPMRRRQKALQKTIENLKRGDRVVTTGGFYGEVVAIEGRDLMLKLADNVKVRVAKSAVAGLESEE